MRRQPLPNRAPAAEPNPTLVIAAYAAVYVLWGSTYLAIRYAIDSLPPLLMAGSRFVVAGGLLYGVERLRGVPAPPRSGWGRAGLIGGLMLCGGNGCVVWAEQTVSTALAALLVATTPLWMVVLEALRPGGQRPSRRTLWGLAMGLLGLALLVLRPAAGDGSSGAGGSAGSGQLSGALLVVLAALSWAVGSLLSRHRPVPAPPLQGAGMQMLSGGALLLLVGSLHGEWATLRPQAVTLSSLLALLYLIVFGSVIGFTSYMWLLRVSVPARVATYAYVNPVVAVLLGWAFRGETLSLRGLLGAAVIVTAVALIISPSKPS